MSITATTDERSGRLGIVHLLGWMLSCGVVLAIYRALAGQRELSAADSLQLLGFGLTYGTAVGGLATLVWRWRKETPPQPAQPGHWLLIVLSLSFFIDTAFLSAQDWIQSFQERPRSSYVLMWRTQGPILLLSFLPIFVAMRMRHLNRYWLLAVLVSFMTQVIRGPFHPLFNLAGPVSPARLRGAAKGHLPFFPIVAIGVFLVVLSVCLDRWKAEKRDWLHVAGLVAYALSVVVSLGTLGYLMWPV